MAGAPGAPGAPGATAPRRGRGGWTTRTTTWCLDLETATARTTKPGIARLSSNVPQMEAGGPGALIVCEVDLS